MLQDQVKRYFYIVGIAILLFMPNSVGIEENEREQVAELSPQTKSLDGFSCDPAPVGISYGRTVYWKDQWCEFIKPPKTITLKWDTAWNVQVTNGEVVRSCYVPSEKKLRY